MGLFGFLSGGSSQPSSRGPEISDIAWAKDDRGKYRRFMTMKLPNAAIEGIGGVFVIWHSGVKPGWVYVGCTTNLSADLTALHESRDILDYESRGGVFVTWYAIDSARAGRIFKFLHDALKPAVPNPDADSYAKKQPLYVLPPGYTMESFKKVFLR